MECYFLIASSLFTFLLLLISYFYCFSWASCFLIFHIVIKSSWSCSVRSI